MARTKKALPPPGSQTAAADVSKTKSGKKKKARKESYGVSLYNLFTILISPLQIYIHRVLKQVHPDAGISTKAMSIMTSFVNDIFEQIATEASRLSTISKKSSISSREIQTAVRLILPGELSKHAISEGTKAVSKYTSSK